MNELRISLGLLACIVFLLAIAPGSPTLISVAPAGPREVAELSTASDETAASVGSNPAEASQVPETATSAIRAVDPAPYAAGDNTALTRVSPAASASKTSSTQPKLEMFNRPVAVDAGTMKAGRTTLRVADVEPISPDTRCSDGPQTWPCGVRARTAFRSWLRGRSVMCSVPPDAQGSDDLTVSCLAGEADIGEWLVGNGWAAASSGGRYAELGESAKNQRKGIWAFDLGQ